MPGTVPVGLIAAALQIVVATFVVPTGFSLAYSDAQSHLTIARRLLDSTNGPGIQQLGTVWLPVPHLLLAPLVMSLWLWHTGWGAAILGAACMGATAAGVYRAAARWGAGRAARLAAAAVVVVNPTMLYLCCTALTEPVLIASMAACLAGLSNYATRRRPSSPGELAIFAGIPAAAAALSRYEGWALCLTGAVFVAAVTWRRAGRAGPVLSAVVGFLAVPVAAIGWWVGYNWVVFHDPLEFFSGQFSANAQQAGIVAEGASTKFDAGATVRALDMAVTSSVGWASTAVAALGLVAVLAGRGRGSRLMVLVVSASSYLFLAVALYAGQAIIWNSAVRSGYAWNNRFGMASILPVALLGAAAVEGAVQLAEWAGRGRWTTSAIRAAVGLVMALVLAGQAGWVMQNPAGRSLVITEAAVSWHDAAGSREAAGWLRSHYDGGRILMDETGSANAQLPTIGLPLHDFYLQADGALFRRVLADPSAHARWVWVSSSGQDAVRAVSRTSAFRRDYRPVFADPEITIYQRRAS